MNKTELISEIINICDKAENYDRLMTTHVSAEPKKGMTLIDEMVVQIGRKHIVDEVVRDYWAYVNVEKNEETGVVEVQSFESWVNENVKNVPEYMSKRDFISYFDAELREKYEEKRDIALSRFEGE